MEKESRIQAQLDNMDLAFAEVQGSITDLTRGVTELKTSMPERSTNVTLNDSDLDNYLKDFSKKLRFDLQTAVKTTIKGCMREMRKDSLYELFNLQSDLRELKTEITKTYSCVVPVEENILGKCHNSNILIYFCSNCKKSYPICDIHLRKYRKITACAVRGRMSMSRRFAFPLPLSDSENEIKFS